MKAINVYVGKFSSLIIIKKLLNISTTILSTVNLTYSYSTANNN